MAVLNDLIAQIENAELRRRIEAEVDRLNKQKKFGLVFEEHLPECTPLYDIPVKKGSLAALRAGKVNEVYRVLEINGEEAVCVKKDGTEPVIFALRELVSVAEFGEPIYPYLKPLDSVCNAPDSDLWHTLIEADNYHALQLLEYLYAGKVDCIYIDPPYNTGARDWKYNNDYVDGADTYRHSKWLSMMQKRLKIAKKLLNPKDSVMIVTIDEKEYLHLGCLLEEMFPEANIQMISTCINPGGVSRGSFRRIDEYYFFVMIGVSSPVAMQLDDAWFGGDTCKHVKKMNWRSFCRSGSNSLRSDRPNLFYPIFVHTNEPRVHSVGETYYGDDRTKVQTPEGTVAVWPLHADKSEGYWMYTQDGLKNLIEKGYFHIGGKTKEGYALYYLNLGEQKKVESGVFRILGRDPVDGSIITEQVEDTQKGIAPTQWRIPSHNARIGGTEVLKKLIPNHDFSFPKSIYAVSDSLRFFLINKPNALIVDFFSGSGTTLHAVNLLNAEDGGSRRCIMVTNNEVSADEAKSLSEKGFQPGDEEWNKLGIARYVTWPRTVCSIEGHDVKGNPLKGNYLGSDKPMAEGFKANAAFFKLGFLDKTSVALGRQFKEMLPTLWMKAGAIGECPVVTEDTPNMLVLPKNKFAVLADERMYMEFIEELDKHPEIETVYIVTDSERAYRDMIAFMDGKNTYQLYRDYLDNFRINSVRR